MGKGGSHHDVEVNHAFVVAMCRLHIRAGKPTLKEMEEISKHQHGLTALYSSTVNDILQRKRTRLPKLQLVESFVTVCRIYAERNHVPLGQSDTVDEWTRKWRVASTASIDTAPWPVAAANTLDTGDRDRYSSGDLVTAQRATMLALARHVGLMGWWQPYRDVIPEWFETYLSLEPAADRIRTYEPGLIPELLQTQEYARTVIRLGHRAASAEEIDQRVALRMTRQRILHQVNATTLWAIIDEEALNNTKIPAATLRAQVKHLIEADQRAKVSLQLMPAGLAAVAGSITILRFPERELPDVVYLGQLTSGLYPDESNDGHDYSQVLDGLGIEAIKRAKTMRKLGRMAVAPTGWRLP